MEEAVKWYQKAAQQGYHIAQKKLAQIYRNGNGVIQNSEMARYWSDRAEGNPSCSGVFTKK